MVQFLSIIINYIIGNGDKLINDLYLNNGNVRSILLIVKLYLICLIKNDSNNQSEDTKNQIDKLIQTVFNKFNHLFNLSDDENQLKESLKNWSLLFDMKEIANDKLIEIFEFIIQQFSKNLESLRVSELVIIFKKKEFLNQLNHKIENYVYETIKSKLNTLKQDEIDKLITNNKNNQMGCKDTVSGWKIAFFIILVSNIFYFSLPYLYFLPKIEELMYVGVYQFEKHLSPTGFDSKIVDFSQSIDLIKLCEFDTKTEFKLLYRASRDGFSSNAFHSKCNNISKTLIIIKVKDKPHIFGGYTEATWEGYGTFKQDPNAFIFSLVNDDNGPIKMTILNQYIHTAIEGNPFWSAIFGGGADFAIYTDSDTNTESYSNLGTTYQHPNYQQGSNEVKHFLAGSFKFSTSEIEVYQVI